MRPRSCSPSARASSCSTTASTCSTRPARSPRPSGPPPPTVVVVATSREPLGIDGEHVVVLDPLALPAPGGADAERSPAVELFLERAGGGRRRCSSRARRCSPTSPSCAADSTACRWPSSWPRRGRGRSRPATCWRSSTSGSTCSGGRAGPATATTRCAPRSRSSTSLLRRRASAVLPPPRRVQRTVRPRSGPRRRRRRRTTARLASLDRPRRARRAVAGDGRAARRRATRYRLLELLREHALDELAAADELHAVEERFVEAMVAAADDIVARALEQVGPGRCSARRAASTPTSCAACELCLDRDPGPDRAYRLLLPMFAAVHEGRPERGLAARRPGARALGRRRRAVAGRGVRRAGDRRGDRRSRTTTSARWPRPWSTTRPSSDVALALADRAWGLASRPADPIAAARHFELARGAAERAGFASMALEVQAFEAGELDVAGDASGRSTCSPTCCGAARLPTTCSSSSSPTSCAAGCCSGRATSTRPRRIWPRPRRHRRRWASRGGRRRCCARRPRSPRSAPAGGRHRRRGGARPSTSPPAGARSARSPSRCATAASVAQHLGEHEQAAVLFAAVPRSTAITVLPELFPDAMAELRGRRRPPDRSGSTSSTPCSGPGPRSDAVGAATRAGTGDARPRRSPAAATRAPSSSPRVTRGESGSPGARCGSAT